MADDRMPRRTLIAAAAVLAVGAIGLGVVAATGVGGALPVVTALGGPDAAPTPIAAVDPGLAVTALLAVGAIVLGVAAASVADRRRGVLLTAGWSQGAGILVFLIARANGIAEVAALVPMYAIGAAAVGLQAIDPGPQTPTWRRPGAWAAALGIVPWGVIAFVEVGATIVGTGPSLGIRIATLVALAVAVTGWALLWRRRAGTAAVVAMAVGLDLAGYLLVAAS